MTAASYASLARGVLEHGYPVKLYGPFYRRSMYYGLSLYSYDGSPPPHPNVLPKVHLVIAESLQMDELFLMMPTWTSLAAQLSDPLVALAYLR